MALTRTAAQLETTARSRADQVGSAFRSQATVFEYLSASCRDLVSKLHRLDDYWTATTTVNTAANTASSTFTTSAWKLLALRVTINGERVLLDKAGIDQIDIEVTPTGWNNGIKPAYRLRGDLLLWVPIPTAIHTVTVEYLPVAIFKNSGGTAINNLAATTDTFDGIFGWEDWVTVHTAIKLRGDAEKDTSSLRAELAEREAEIILAATQRDADRPERIRDTWRSDGLEEEVEDYR